METSDIGFSGQRTPNPRCRVCDSVNIKLKGVKRGRFVDADFYFYDCRDCGFLFVDPITDVNVYNDAYYAGHGIDPLVNYQEEYTKYASTARRFEFEDFVRFAQNHLSRPEVSALSGKGHVNWLDFGCGAGGLLKYLRISKLLTCDGRQTAVHPVGHDIGSYAERLKRDDGFEILDWDELSQLPPGRFDIITCIEVIEHVPHPWSVIDLLARNLKEGGLLILTTGNLDSPLAKLQGIKFGYCIPEIHISLLTPKLLERLYRRAGLAPIRLRYYGSIKFRFLKNLPRIRGGELLVRLANFRVILRLADWVFGVSAMPSAFKPVSRYCG